MPALDRRPVLVPASGGLFGWPGACETSSQHATLGILGAPSDTGNAISRGAARGPGAIRKASENSSAPMDLGCDFGDIDFRDRWGSASHIDATVHAVRGVVAAGHVPFLLGGDHSLTFAPVSVLQETQDLCLLWFDAHTDFSPWDGRDFHNHKQVLRRIETLPGVRRIIQLGYRGVTVGDERRLGPKATVVTSAGMRRSSAEQLLALVPVSQPCYVSIDIDVVDPFCAPGTSAPVPGGVLPAQICAFLELIARHRLIVGADIVEVNPALDRRDDTSRTAVRFVEAFASNWHHQAAMRRTTRSMPRAKNAPAVAKG